MNDKKIAFILCVNDSMELDECSYYLGRLQIPEGYEAEVIAVSDASSMAAGYNEAMQSSDAKYKVYMHQDVFIKNAHFIEDMLDIFRSDARIGMLGMIGRTYLAEHLVVAMDWNAGNIFHNCVDGIMDFSADMEEIQAVEAVDGLLMATQYDVHWREDLFDGWDFYDISQCMEFLRAGYRIVVPRQKNAWCYHDNSYSRLKNYFAYQERFAKEYTDIRAFRVPTGNNEALEREELLESLKSNLMMLMGQGNKTAVAEIFTQIGNTCYLSLRELAAISQIDRLESQNGVENLFWKNGMTVQELIEKLRVLKYQIKRIEFDACVVEEMTQRMCEGNSVFAVATVVNYYAGYKSAVVTKVKEHYRKENLEWEYEVLKEISKAFTPGF